MPVEPSTSSRARSTRAPKDVAPPSPPPTTARRARCETHQRYWRDSHHRRNRSPTPSSALVRARSSSKSLGAPGVSRPRETTASRASDVAALTRESHRDRCRCVVTRAVGRRGWCARRRVRRRSSARRTTHRGAVTLQHERGT